MIPLITPLMTCATPRWIHQNTTLSCLRNHGAFRISLGSATWTLMQHRPLPSPHKDCLMSLFSFPPMSSSPGEREEHTTKTESLDRAVRSLSPQRFCEVIPTQTTALSEERYQADSYFADSPAESTLAFQPALTSDPTLTSPSAFTWGAAPPSDPSIFASWSPSVLPFPLNFGSPRGVNCASLSAHVTSPSPQGATFHDTRRRNKLCKKRPLPPAPGSSRCTFCGLKMARSCDLRRHMRSHSDAKVICGGIPLAEALSAGIDVKRAHQFEFESVVYYGGCMRMFSRSDTLLRHLKGSEKNRGAMRCHAHKDTPYNLAARARSPSWSTSSCEG
ncbi:hypothetical protein BKA93DRAFT_399267 [Sparassis latifolia]